VDQPSYIPTLFQIDDDEDDDIDADDIDIVNEYD